MNVGEKYKQGRYTVLRKLGWGHFSTVWLVQDNQTGGLGAMKVRQGGKGRRGSVEQGVSVAERVCRWGAWSKGGGGLKGCDLMLEAERQPLVLSTVQLQRMALWALLVWWAGGTGKGTCVCEVWALTLCGRCKT